MFEHPTATAVEVYQPTGLTVNPLTVAREVAVEWKRPKIDLAELAKLRNDGLTIKELMAHFKCGKTSIWDNVKRLKEREQAENETRHN